MFKKSIFCILERVNSGILMKNTFTGSVILLSYESERALSDWLKNQNMVNTPLFLDELISNGFFVNQEIDEFQDWYQVLFEIRNHKAHMFSLHFEPTLQCQLACSYCFEDGINRNISMKSETVSKAVFWLKEYLDNNPEINVLRLKFFGGEPLLRKDIIALALEEFFNLCKRYNIDFWAEITTNGELLDEKTAKLFSQYNWKYVYITLDGPEKIHDARRKKKNGKSAFNNIMRNIKMLLKTDYISKVNIRLTLDNGTKNYLKELIDFLANTGKQNRINLSLGYTVPSFSNTVDCMDQENLANSALSIWEYAKKKGFNIPDEFVVGPICVATAKHSAVLQPDGTLQKCFCTSGRSEYNFSDITIKQELYTKDPRFEQRRIDECITEQCSYLPLCGGDCIYNALVANSDKSGFSKRFCQKTLLDIMNRGLLKLTYA